MIAQQVEIKIESPMKKVVFKGHNRLVKPKRKANVVMAAINRKRVNCRRMKTPKKCMFVEDQEKMSDSRGIREIPRRLLAAGYYTPCRRPLNGMSYFSFGFFDTSSLPVVRRSK
jgi:hypothetical protein